MNIEKPFVYLLKENKNNYIYDVNSNDFLMVDDCIYDIFKFNNDKNNCKLKKKYSKNEIDEKANLIKNSIEKEKLFLRNPLSKLQFHSLEDIVDRLENNLNQLTLVITENCNLKCKYCLYSGNYCFEKTHSDKKMNEDVAIKAIDFFFQHNKKNIKPYISFYGGEPLLNFKLLKKCIEYVKKKYSEEKEIEFILTTNAVLINDDIIDYFIENKVGLLISLDGPKEIHDRYRIDINKKGSFETILKNILKIKNKSIEYYNNYVIYNFTLTPPFKLGEIEEFVDNCELFKEKNLLINLMNPNDNSFFKSLNSDEKLEKLEYFKQEKKLLKKYCEKVLIGNIKDYPFLKGLFDNDFYNIHYRKDDILKSTYFLHHVCIPGASRLLVDYSGNLYFCPNVSSNMPIGNISDGFNYNKISELVKNFIKISKKDCLKCWAIHFCDICFIHAVKGEVFSLSRKKLYCDGLKRKLLKLFKAYLEFSPDNLSAFSFLNRSNKMN